MRKLIERKDEYLMVICDNPKCNFKVSKKDYPDKQLKDFINVLCPVCGENLLTEKDYFDYLTMLKFIDFLNKWFSWLTIFISKKQIVSADVNVHDGIHIKQRK